MEDKSVTLSKLLKFSIEFLKPKILDSIQTDIDIIIKQSLNPEKKKVS
jgi:hypothetical protein